LLVYFHQFMQRLRFKLPVRTWYGANLMTSGLNSACFIDVDVPGIGGDDRAY
jgi:hypothetical protein